jgi:hypothetical protein
MNGYGRIPFKDRFNHFFQFILELSQIVCVPETSQLFD